MGGHTHLPKQIKHELVDSSGSQARIPLVLCVSGCAVPCLVSVSTVKLYCVCVCVVRIRVKIDPGQINTIQERQKSSICYRVVCNRDIFWKVLIIQCQLWFVSRTGEKLDSGTFFHLSRDGIVCLSM